MKKKIILLAVTIILLGSGTAGITVSETIPSLTVMFSNSTKIETIDLTNTGNQSQTVTTQVNGELKKITKIQKTTTVPAKTSRELKVVFNTTNIEPKLYVGEIIVESKETTNIPVAIRIRERKDSEIKADIQSTATKYTPKQPIKTLTVITTSLEEKVNATLHYEIRKASTGVKVYQTTVNKTLGNTQSFTLTLDPITELKPGNYYIQLNIQTQNQVLTVTDTFIGHDPFWTPTKIKVVLFLIAGAVIIGGGFYIQRWYQQRKQEEARYVFPVDYNKLPADSEDNYWVGKIAETEKEAYIDPDDLTTHAIVAGSTGSGKSVTANLIAEEALENDVPVVVFDPTAQWTGFVKELKDEDIMDHYERFDMDEQEDPHPYRGIIKEISSGDPDINFKQLRNEGEITVFTLNQLTTEEFDSAVRNIIDQIFEEEWEEQNTLQLFIVFDEVHRLLEKYGGEGGYEALERGAREFRKWGIGLMMASQVTADFKQAISGNIMTEVQMQTKSMEDINRIEKKYGEEFSKRISSEDVGTGMIQNSNYNDGKPWFVDFRPPYHNPHKIPDEELEKYHELSEKLDNLRKKLEQKQEQGEDIQDLELELNLAENKLKEGRFKMANMYIDSLKDEMGMS